MGHRLERFGLLLRLLFHFISAWFFNSNRRRNRTLCQEAACKLRTKSEKTGEVDGRGKSGQSYMCLVLKHCLGTESSKNLNKLQRKKTDA